MVSTLALVLGFAGATGNLELPAGLETLQAPLVIGIACLMYVVEFFADKTPGVDSAWDSAHTHCVAQENSE